MGPSTAIAWAFSARHSASADGSSCSPLTTTCGSRTLVQMREQARRFSNALAAYVGGRAGTQAQVVEWGARAIHYWWDTAPNWSSHLSLQRERASLFINGGFTFSGKQGELQPVQESGHSKSGHQRETELEVSQALLLLQGTLRASFWFNFFFCCCFCLLFSSSPSSSSSFLQFGIRNFVQPHGMRWEASHFSLLWNSFWNACLVRSLIEPPGLCPCFQLFQNSL